MQSQLQTISQWVQKIDAAALSPQIIENITQAVTSQAQPEVVADLIFKNLSTGKQTPQNWEQVLRLTGGIYSRLAHDLSATQVDVEKVALDSTETPLGVYRDPKVKGYYSDDPVMDSAKEMEYYGFWRATQGGYGLASTLRSGAFKEGSKMVVVYGTDKPSSWKLLEYKKDGGYDIDGLETYGWMPTHRSYGDVLQLDVVKDMMKKYDSK